jgi:polar amino acid transport system substrate-binding protein
VAGVADALALSLPSVKWMSKQDILTDLEGAQPFVPLAAHEPGYAAFAFRKRDLRLRAAWDRALSDFLATPEHQALIARFGLTVADVPVPPAGRGEGPE